MNRMREVVLVVLAIVASAMPTAGEAMTRADLQAEARGARLSTIPMTPLPAMPVRSADSCCKHCSKGQPCGDSCIAKDKQCRKGKGCAC